MTGRTVKEWVGNSPDSAAPKRVRLRVFQAHEGYCAITDRKITASDDWQLDHILALANGGENRENNLQPVLTEAHKAKTAKDVAQKAKDRRVAQKHAGIHRPKAKLPGSKGTTFKKRVDGTVVRREGK